MSNFLIYGSYGYTGDLIAREAVQRGHRPILASRDPHRLAAQAVELGCQHFAFALDDTAALDRALQQVAVVLHCAGPFKHTAQAMADACLRRGVHYLDITGEIAVFEALAARDAEARAAGVMLLPGAGFDVVPSDCLAAHLHRRLPTATHLTLGIRGLGAGTSRGTALTAVEGLGSATVVRRDGQLVTAPVGSLRRRIDFGRGPKDCVAIGWGDVSTAYHSTGIPNIEVYFYFPPNMVRAMAASRYAAWLLKSGPVQSLLRAGIRRGPTGPSAEQRATGSSLLWGEVVDAAGQRCVSRLRTPEGYALTVQTALAAAQKALAGEAKPGFQTPSLAFGPDFILEFPGVEREDVET
jgi:short subunit dehydrogenase-like uncharacterized protein